jgi:hypothetical protein
MTELDKKRMCGLKSNQYSHGAQSTEIKLREPHFGCWMTLSKTLVIIWMLSLQPSCYSVSKTCPGAQDLF